MRRLAVQKIRHLDRGVMKLVLFVTYIADAIAGDLLDTTQVVVQRRLVGQPHLATDHHAVRRREGFAGDAGLRFLGQKGIEDGVRNPVTDLVRVPFGHGFRGEGIILATAHEVLRL